MFQKFSTSLLRNKLDNLNFLPNTNKIIYKKFNEKINNALINSHHPHYPTLITNIKNKSIINVNDTTIMYCDKKLIKYIDMEITQIINQCKEDLNNEYIDEINQNYHMGNQRHMEQTIHEDILSNYSIDVKNIIVKLIYDYIKKN